MECHKWHMNFADISVAGDFAHPRHLIVGLVLQRIDSGGRSVSLSFIERLVNILWLMCSDRLASSCGHTSELWWGAGSF
jgi:hypothetical protein